MPTGSGRTRCIPLLALLGALCTNTRAENLNFQHYGIGDGLPQTQVRSIHQDATGFLWVGTYGGLGRYDGREFTVFSTDDGLNSNNIFAITSTADRSTWAGTTNGLCYLPPRETAFQCLDDPLLNGVHVLSLLPDDTGGVWVGTERGLLRARADGTVRPVGSQPLEVTTLLRADGTMWIGAAQGLFYLAGEEIIAGPALPGGETRVRALLHEDDRLWIGAASGLLVLKNGSIMPAPGLPARWMQDDVNALAHGVDDTMWAATDHGVLRRHHGQFELLEFGDGLMSNINFTVFVDREGVVWLGHDDGLSKYVPGPFTGYREAHGLLHYFVRTINEDARGRLWLGTRSGAQIVPYENGEWRIDRSVTITARDGLVDERIYSIALRAPDDAYLATGDGVAHWREGRGVVRRYTTADGLPVNATQALLLDGERLWIGTNSGVRILEDNVIRAPADAGLASAYVYRIRADARGRLWFGSQDQGLFMRAPSGAFTRFGKAQGLTEETIWDVAPDAEGGVWVGSNGDGLFHVNADGTIRRYTTNDGLIDNFVWQVLVDDSGSVWAYTNRGISRFDGAHFKSYGQDDGLLHLEGGATGAWQSHDGQLWFASADGLMRYDPAHERDNAVPPAIVILDVRHDETPIHAGTELQYGNGSLTFDYAALSFQSEEQLRYAFRLQGADENWSAPLSYRPITYANLGPGNYVFEVLARNPDGAWSRAPARFAFRVLPPYWATWWFWAGTAIVVLLLLRGWVLLRTRRAEMRHRELENIVAIRTTELEAANQLLKTASLVDPLTGLNNRRFLVSQIATDIAQSRRAHRETRELPNRDIVFMMIDVDHFKEINDVYGHGAGDRVLRQYAELLRSQIRESDYVVRWGGEEFLVVARHAEAMQANVIARRIVAKARATRFVIDDNGRTIACTCSVGVSHFPFVDVTQDAFSWEQIVDVADMAVYMAKANGRDGWVAIHGTGTMAAGDSALALRKFRDDMPGCIAAGELVVESSFGEALKVTLVDDGAAR